MTTDEIMRLADNFANLHRHSTDRASNVARKDLRTAVEQLAASQGEQAKVPLKEIYDAALRAFPPSLLK